MANELIDQIKQLIDLEITAIRNIPINESIISAVDMIHQRVHKQNGKLVIAGMGKAGQIGHNIATTFCSTGTPAVFLHPGEAQHGDLGILRPSDVLFLVSNSGKTREILELITLAKKLYPDIPIIALTGNATSGLAQQADALLWTGGPQEIDHLRLTPTTSTTVMTVLGDLLVVLLMKKINFTKADYALRHHGGYLGQKTKFDK